MLFFGCKEQQKLGDGKAFLRHVLLIQTCRTRQAAKHFIRYGSACLSSGSCADYLQFVTDVFIVCQSVFAL